MIAREDLKQLLQERLQDCVPAERIEKIVREILELEQGWEEMSLRPQDMGYSTSLDCSSICWLASQVEQGAVLKIYRKKNLK